MSPDVLSTRRAQMMRLVRAEPGITTAALARRMGISNDVADYHARRLARAGLLVRERSAKGILHFARLQGPSEDARRWASLPASVRSVLSALEADPDFCALELQPRVPLRMGGLRWALYAAHDLGLVEARKVDRRHFYRLTNAGSALVRAGRPALEAAVAA
jgi:predicted transcriptional regulator